jgi:hypothetical protein
MLSHALEFMARSMRRTPAEIGGVAGGFAVIVEQRSRCDNQRVTGHNQQR